DLPRLFRDTRMARGLQKNSPNRWCASERPAVASVADPSAIAPPLPLSSRSDAAPPAGGSSAFSDLLDGTTPPTAPQPQSAATPAAQRGGAPVSSGKNTSAPAAAMTTARPRAGKDDDASDSTDSASPVDVTLVPGLPMPPLALAAQDPQGESTDATPAAGGGAGDKPSDRNDANATSDSVLAGLVPAVPNLIPTAVAAGGDTSSAPDATSPVGSSPIPALQSAAILFGPSTSPQAAGEGASNSASTQQPGGAVDPSPSVSATAENALAAMLSVTSALPQVDALQTA